MSTHTLAPAPGMTPRGYPLRDSATMLRRNLKHMQRYPSLTLMLIGQPIVFLLLFVYVFGGTLGGGISGGSGGRAQYITYVTPAILVMAVASVALGTAISVAVDMTGGIIARFRTMAISRGAVLAGHVLGAMIQSLLAVAVVLGVALGLGFHTAASPGQWLGAVGMLALFALAMTWLTLALGLVSKTVEAASNLPMFLVLLPFLGSGFVPTDSMPGWLAWFARNQPFTAAIEAIRALVAGSSNGHAIWLGVVWSLAIAALGYAWSRRLYIRRTTQ